LNKKRFASVAAYLNLRKERIENTRERKEEEIDE
jgi:hypothetical protein